ncbi:MAG: hypothetical protein Q8O19_02420, partial [Rectinemataceae bacterium]|nr:hypothetical protein [Rectinemataceae bacterium]
MLVVFNRQDSAEPYATVEVGPKAPGAAALQELVIAARDATVIKAQELRTTDKKPPVKESPAKAVEADERKLLKDMTINRSGSSYPLKLPDHAAVKKDPKNVPLSLALNDSTGRARLTFEGYRMDFSKDAKFDPIINVKAITQNGVTVDKNKTTEPITIRLSKEDRDALINAPDQKSKTEVLLKVLDKEINDAQKRFDKGDKSEHTLNRLKLRDALKEKGINVGFDEGQNQDRAVTQPAPSGLFGSDFRLPASLIEEAVVRGEALATTGTASSVTQNAGGRSTDRSLA